MKKLLCAFFVMVMLLPLSACKAEETVTIYIPESAAVTPGDEMEMTAVKYVYVLEEGWQTKESFSATLEEVLPGVDTGTNAKVVYSDCTVVMEQPGVVMTTTVYNEKGLVVSSTTETTRGTTPLRTETTSTYDARGRKLSEETKTSYQDQDKPAVTGNSYTYTETDTGSEGRSEEGYMITVLTYDKNDRLICKVTTVSGEEVARIENTYDEVGNLILSQTFGEGKLITKSEYTYRAVKVSRETADRLPNFKRGN